MRLWPSATGTAISSPNQVCLGGSMNYDELPLYGGLPPRSNGRAVIRSTNGGSLAPDVTWQDITAVLGSDGKVAESIHPRPARRRLQPAGLGDRIHRLGRRCRPDRRAQPAGHVRGL